MKENQHVKPEINLETNTVTFTVKGYDVPLVLHMAQVHPDVQARAALVGMAQVRIVDAAAIGMTDKDGNIIPERERLRMKYEAMEELIAHYETGTPDWSRNAGGGARETGITIEAIARHYGKTVEEARAMVEAHAERKYEGDTRKALAKLATAKAIAQLILTIKGERLAKMNGESAADEMLEELK